jgi:hypothetical protein
MAAVDLDPQARLCVCGVRGCDFADQHCNAFVGAARGRRVSRGPVRSYRRRRRT